MAGPEDLEHEVVHHEKSLWGDVIALVVIVIPLDSGNFIEWVIEGLKTTQTISDNEKMASQLGTPSKKTNVIFSDIVTKGGRGSG